MQRARPLISVALLVLLAAAVGAPASRAQMKLSRSDAALASARRFEGMRSIPQETIKSVLADTATLAWYADALEGRAAWPIGADTAYMLYYLVLSRRPSFTPEFLRFAVESGSWSPPNTFRVAVAGLAEQAALPEARARMLRLSASWVAAQYRMHLANDLMIENSSVARDVLRQMSLDGFSPQFRERITTTLQALPREQR
jgi:hypothetical protein